MKRKGWHAIAVALGLFGSAARADDWRPAAGAEQPPARLPVESLQIDRTAPATEPAWRAATGAAISPAAILDAIWRPPGGRPITSHGPRIAESTTADLHRPRVIEGEPAPIVERMLKPAAASDLAPMPAVPPLKLPQESTLKLAAKEAPSPVVQAPVEPPVVPNPKPETLPLPAPTPMPTPAAEPAPPLVLPPQAAAPPRAASEPVPSALPPAAVEASGESTAVWGGYNNALSPFVSNDCLPSKHAANGSDAVRISRDYKLLKSKEPAASAAVAEGRSGGNSFVEGEVLFWWVNSGTVPTLATTAMNSQFGYLGAPGTTALFGPGPFGDAARNGFRFRAGWFSDCNNHGINASLFVLGRETVGSTIDSNDFPTIARPFFAANLNGEFVELVAFPGVATGRLEIEQTSFLWGADINYSRRPCQHPCMELFAGFRYLNLQETLSITETLTAGPNAPDPVGTRITVRDQFTAKNNFYGPQLGAAGGWRFGRAALDVRGSIALGATNRELIIEGFQTRTRPGQPREVFAGGLLAAGPNLGTFEQNVFSAVPEVTINLGVFVRPNVKAYIGYNLIAWSGVVRPGNAIDRVVDLTFVPNAPDVPFAADRPQPVFASSTAVIQGIQFGLQGSW